MLDDFHPAITEIENLSSLSADECCLVKSRGATGADLRSMNDNLIGMSDLGESFDFRLLRVGDARFGVFDPFLNLLKIVINGTDAHLVQSKDVLAVNEH